MAHRIRTRTSIVLLSALLLAIVAVSGFTIKLLEGQRTVLEEAIRQSQTQAVALLSNRVEQSLLNALRAPFQTLKSFPFGSLSQERLKRVKESFPEIDQVLVLDSKMGLRHSFPAPADYQQRVLNRWLAQHTVVEGADRRLRLYGEHSFVETVGGRPALFAVQPVNDVDEKDGWLLIRFNLDLLQARHVAPLLEEFVHDEGGSIVLRDAEADWDESALNWPLSRVLPGWMLVFKADPQDADQRLRRQSGLVLGVAGAVLLAMLMATFSVWREIRREHALVDLRNRFVANVSHELKTPLALIRMYAETLYLRRVTDEERQHHYHRTIVREAERLTEMIDAVLDFARLSQGVKIYHLTDMDLRETVEDVMERYRPRIEEQGLRLEVDLKAHLPPVAHDRHGVTQILLNLIDNAVKYGASGGMIQVQLAAQDGDWVELAVIDSGPGIPVEERTRLRKAFHRGAGADPSSGAGLGLALVEQIAGAHHAHLILDTPDKGRGVKAVVSFPTYKTLA